MPFQFTAFSHPLVMSESLLSTAIFTALERHIYSIVKFALESEVLYLLNNDTFCCCRVASKSNKNSMGSSNLSVCFGPTLIHPEEETVAAIYDIKFCNIVVDILIENHVQVSRIFHGTIMDGTTI